jgi:hypothetical protein
MKECLSCHTFFKESTMRCQGCSGALKEVSLGEALEHTRKKFLRHFSEDKNIRIFDPHTQYVVSSYFNNHSLFLYFDLSKHQLKYGRHFERFFIQPVNLTAFINVPWFVFNLLYTNYFHLFYTAHCAVCNCKHLEDHHPKEECEYNGVYFQILCDVLNGDIVYTKKVYEEYYRENKEKRIPNAFADLSKRHKRVEFFLDLLSISLSLFVWLYLFVYVGFPSAKTAMQMLQMQSNYRSIVF